MNWWDDPEKVARYRANVAVRRGVAEAGPRPARPPVTRSVLDRLTALVEAFEPSTALVAVPTPTPDAVAPVDAIEPDLSPEAMAKMTAAEFRAMSALRWSDAFGHLDGGSPYSRAYGTPGPLAPFRADGS